MTKTSAHFTFTGTASGPYSGTFTENGTITYALSRSSDNIELFTGVVTRFSGWFTIKVRSGWVTGLETLDETASSGVWCDRSPGGMAVTTGTCHTFFGGLENCYATPAATRYVAVIATQTGVHVYQGASTVTLGATQEGGVPIPEESNISVGFGSPGAHGLRQWSAAS